MKNNIYSIKGTKDILPDDSIKWRFIENKVHKIMKNWGFGQIRTPVFEKTQLFKRSVGEETDIVSKQMYSFKDQSDNDLTLRPELTAPVMRAYIQHNMERHYGSLNKLYYIDSLYRQERPQAGRLREFSQFGAEAIGSENPEQDLEIIFLVLNIFKDLGLDNLNILINSVGNIKSRENYKKDLIKFFQPHKKKLSEISKKRLEANPLRILEDQTGIGVVDLFLAENMPDELLLSFEDLCANSEQCDETPGATESQDGFFTAPENQLSVRYEFVATNALNAGVQLDLKVEGEVSMATQGLQYNLLSLTAGDSLEYKDPLTGSIRSSEIATLSAATIAILTNVDALTTPFDANIPAGVTGFKPIYLIFFTYINYFLIWCCNKYLIFFAYF